MKIKTFLFIIIVFFSTKVFCDEISNQSVITEEYVAKVIIEGKWGTNAGEFGQTFISLLSENSIVPNSLAVNSKGDIYILDIANNRIQKFNKDGKYIKSISVPSWKGYKLYNWSSDWSEWDILPAEAEGKNIVIDSEDNLYYYFIKYRYKKQEEADRDKDGRVSYLDLIEEKDMRSHTEWLDNPEAKGEVWLFKNDRLVRKWETNVMERFEPPPDYEIEKQKLDKDREKVIIKFKDGRRMNFEYKQIDNENRKIQFIDKNGKVKEFQFKPNRKLKENEKYFVSKEPEVKNNRIFISTGIFKRPFNYSDLFTYVYDLEGNLLSIAKGIIFKENPIDSDRYYLETTNEGIKVIKFKREPIK